MTRSPSFACLALLVVLALSACAPGRPVAAAPAAPSDLTATPRSDTALLRWQDNSSDEESFEIERKLGDGGFALLEAVPSDTTSFEVPLAVLGEQESFRVRGVNEVGASSYSNTTTVVVFGVGADGGSIEAGDGVVVSVDQETLSGTTSLPVVVDETPERPYADGVMALGPSTKFALPWGLLSLESAGQIRMTVPRYEHVAVVDPDATDLAAVFLNSSRPHLYAITYVPYDRASGELRILGSELYALAYAYELPDVVEIIVEPIDISGWRVPDSGSAGVSRQSNSEAGLFRVRLDEFDVADAEAMCEMAWQESTMVAGVNGIPGGVPPSDKPPLLLIHGWQVLGNYQTYKKRHSDEGLKDELWERLLAWVAPIHGQPLYRYAPQVCTWFDMLEGLGIGGLDQHYEIYTFAYDSDLGVVSNAARLKAAIDKFDPATKVTVLAHSMGGLLTNAYIHANGASRINHVVTLGTPYRGVSVLVCSNDDCSKVEAVFDKQAAAAAAVISAGTWNPAALKVYHAFKEFVTIAARHQGTKNLAWDNPTLSSINNVARDYGQFTSFYGDLTGAYDIVGSVIRALTRHDNDGVVPLDSARLIVGGAPRIADVRSVAAVNHTDLPRNPTTMVAVLDVLRQVVPEPPAPPTPVVTVSIAPITATLEPNASRSFTATVTGATNTSVSWTATCGGIAGSGNTITYTAPSSAGSCSLTASSVEDASRSASATVTVTDGVPIAGADLVVRDLSVTPTAAVAGSSVTVAFHIENIGDASSGASTVRVRVNDDPTNVTTSDPLLAQLATTALAAGQSQAYTQTVSLPSGLADGTHYVWVIADVFNEANQSNYDNDRGVLPIVIGGSGFDPAPSYISISNVSLAAATGGSRRVGFDISWDESWRGPSRPTWVAASDNWDAAWVFVKYRVGGGAWQHATLAGGGHAAPAGSVVSVPGDRMGAFVYRSSSGYGSFAANGVGLQWDYVADGVSAGASVEVRPFGIEMVFVPQGSFSLGSGGSSTGEFRAGGTANTPFGVNSQSSITLGNAAGQLMWTASTYTGSPSGSTNASFPTGYGAFYAMKYQVTQGQYVDFLNTLTQAQADARKHTGSSYRYAISGSSVGSYATSLPFVALNYTSWADGAAFADWAGLRPMSELEFEKAAQGPLDPVANEFAWGSASITQATGLASAGTVAETPTPSGANANYWASSNPIQGPVRVGSFAAPGRSRRDAGAGYYGGLELSGNLWERPVTVGNAEGRAFAGSHGDGSLDAGGNANVVSWPGSTAVGAGFRGGGWDSGDADLRVSDRYIAAFTFANRLTYYGWRGARSAP